MNTLATLLTGRGAHAEMAHVLEDIDASSFGARPHRAPHSIYEELWHLVYWQDLILGWIDGADGASPDHASEGWPDRREPLDLDEALRLVGAFLDGVDRATALASDAERLDVAVRKARTVRGLLESLLAHNAYHAGRIVMLRQLLGIWPPPSGGDTW